VAVDASALVAPVIEAAGYELVEVVATRESGRPILRVTVDRPGGVDLEALTSVSERVSRVLDEAGYAPGHRGYTLEVSSPGIERPLTCPEQFRRAVGSRVKVKTASPVKGSRTHTGVLEHADGEGVVIATSEGALHVAYEDVTSARTVADWNAELQRSHT
jgi:ribosome maturation factor RimP